MTFKISLFNKALILSDFKRYWWVSALYALALIINIPFRHFMDTQRLNINLNAQWLQETVDRTLSLSEDGFQNILICVVPVLLAVLIFRYLQADKASVMMHSLPVNRNSHYASRCFSGLVLLLLPALLTCFILTLLNYFTVLGSFYTMPKILMWLGLNVLFNVLLLLRHSQTLNSVLPLYHGHIKATSNHKICIINMGIPLGIPSKLNWIGLSYVSGMKGFPFNAFTNDSITL